MKFSYDAFTDFCANIDLSRYRNLYSKIKIVEMDLPKNIQALDTIYSIYWGNTGNKKLIPSFEEYYKIYSDTNRDKINEFWDKSGFGKKCSCFKTGLEARIYRTWASLLTQIHAGFVAEKFFGTNTVTMGTDLDHKNIDMLVRIQSGEEIKIQIKKETHRPEFARRHENQQDGAGVYPIWYVVPNIKHYIEQPNYLVGKRKGELRNSLKEFAKFNSHGTLDMLPNGFVIFTPKAFAELITASANVI